MGLGLSHLLARIRIAPLGTVGHSLYAKMGARVDFTAQEEFPC
jgi:hypothetical protein